VHSRVTFVVSSDPKKIRVQHKKTVAYGSPCCEWVGPDGAGHFVKMVHNGIEYGDIQMIAKAYSLLRMIGLENAEIAQIFITWNQGELDS
jgi:6-phosphogluconate dehydrogenase